MEVARGEKLDELFAQPRSQAVNLKQLMGRYFRLKRELTIEYETRPWPSGRTNRLLNEIVVTQREIAAKATTQVARVAAGQHPHTDTGIAAHS